MIPDPALILQAAGALAVLLLPLLLGAQLLRRRRGAGRSGRRLAVQEVLAIDARRRLLLVRCDGRDALLLTGGGQDAVLGWLPGPPP